MKSIHKLALASSLTLGACTPQFGAMRPEPKDYSVPQGPLTIFKEVEKPITAEDLKREMRELRKKLLARLGTDEEGYDAAAKSLTGCIYMDPSQLANFNQQLLLEYMKTGLAARLELEGILTEPAEVRFYMRVAGSEVGLICSRVDFLGQEKLVPTKSTEKKKDYI